DRVAHAEFHRAEPLGEHLLVSIRRLDEVVGGLGIEQRIGNVAVEDHVEFLLLWVERIDALEQFGDDRLEAPALHASGVVENEDDTASFDLRAEEERRHGFAAEAHSGSAGAALPCAEAGGSPCPIAKHAS